MIVWAEGRIVPPETPVIRADDRGFTLGDGLFETIRVEDGRPCHLDLHLARLAEGARLLSMPLPPDGTVERAVSEILAAATGEIGVLRVTLSRGVQARGIETDPSAPPTLVVAGSPPPPVQGPARLGIAVSVRRDEGSILSRVKATHYLPSILARIEVRERGFDEAILLNSGGRIACAAVANLFALIDGEVLTPPAEEGALCGIARALILKAGAARQAPIGRDQLTQAEAIVLTNALRLRAAASIEGRALEPEAAARLLDRLAAASARPAVNGHPRRPPG